MHSTIVGEITHWIVFIRSPVGILVSVQIFPTPLDVSFALQKLLFLRGDVVLSTDNPHTEHGSCEGGNVLLDHGVFSNRCGWFAQMGH